MCLPQKVRYLPPFVLGITKSGPEDRNLFPDALKILYRLIKKQKLLDT